MRRGRGGRRGKTPLEMGSGSPVSKRPRQPEPPPPAGGSKAVDEPVLFSPKPPRPSRSPLPLSSSLLTPRPSRFRREGSQRHDDTVIERENANPTKIATIYPNPEFSLVPGSSIWGIPAIENVDANRPHGYPRAEHQSLPEQRSICALMPSSRNPAVESIDAFHPHGTEEAAKDFQFFFQKPNHNSEISENINEPQFPGLVDTFYTRESKFGGHQYQGAGKMASTNTFQGLTRDDKVEDLCHTKSSTHAQPGIHQFIGLENPFLSSDRKINCDVNAFQMDKHHKMPSSSGKTTQWPDSVGTSDTFDHQKERKLLNPNNGLEGCRKERHGQRRYSRGRGRRGQGGGRISTMEVNKINNNRNIPKQTRRDRPHELGCDHLSGRGHYWVSPRKRSDHPVAVGEYAHEMNYFSDAGDDSRPVIAIWNAEERRANYVLDDDSDGGPRPGKEDLSARDAVGDYKPMAQGKDCNETRDREVIDLVSEDDLNADDMHIDAEDGDNDETETENYEETEDENMVDDDQTTADEIRSMNAGGGGHEDDHTSDFSSDKTVSDF